MKWYQAAEKGQLQSIRELLKYKPNMKAEDKDGKTAWHLAKDEECRKLLVPVSPVFDKLF